MNLISIHAKWRSNRLFLLSTTVIILSRVYFPCWFCFCGGTAWVHFFWVKIALFVTYNVSHCFYILCYCGTRVKFNIFISFYLSALTLAIRVFWFYIIRVIHGGLLGNPTITIFLLQLYLSSVLILVNWPVIISDPFSLLDFTCKRISSLVKIDLLRIFHPEWFRGLLSVLADNNDLTFWCFWFVFDWKWLFMVS